MKTRLTILLLFVSFGLIAAREYPDSAAVSVLTLEDLQDSAAVHSVFARKASLSVLSAREQRREARWAYVPSVSVSSVAYNTLNPLVHITLSDVLGTSDAAWNLTNSLTARAYENGIKPYYDAFSGGYGVSATLLQPLYAGGRIVSGNRLADIGVEAAEIQENMVLGEVRDSVESKFWRIVALQRKGETVDEALELLSSLEKDLGSAVSAGLVSSSDLSALKLRKSELKSAKYRLEGSLILLKMDLLDFVGCEYDVLSVKRLRLGGLPSELPSPKEVFSRITPVDTGNEARLLELQVEAKQAEKKMAEGEYLPQVAVGAAYGYGNMMQFGNGSSNGMVFATVKIPITDIGKLAARSRRYGYEVEKAKMDRDYLTSRLRLREGMLRLEVETLWQEIASAEEGVCHAEDLFEKERVRFSAGKSTGSDLLRAGLDLTTARETLLEKQAAYLAAVGKLLPALLPPRQN